MAPLCKKREKYAREKYAREKKSMNRSDVRGYGTGAGRKKGSKNPNAGRPAIPMSNVPREKGKLATKEIDFEYIVNLAEIQCTKGEVAGFFRISEVTLDKRLVDEFGVGYESLKKMVDGPAKISLRRSQIRQSETNASMAIWLGKIWLEQQDPDKEKDLKRAQIEFATQAIKHAENPIHSEQLNENLPPISTAAAGVSGVDGSDQYLARGSEKWKNVLVNPEVDQTS